MSSINFKRTYSLGDDYEHIRARAVRFLKEYWDNPNLFSFNDKTKTITFTSERLIPVTTTNRPHIMLLFSNPHPHSVQQGMFLSPNTLGRENLFWPVMADAGWLPIEKEDRKPPEKLRDICLNVAYDGPFEFIFYCYYAFPTDYPKDIPKIFGKGYFKQTIESESMLNSRKRFGPQLPWQ